MSVPSNLVPTRISQLPQAQLPLSGNELVPIVQQGVTTIVTASGLAALVTVTSIGGVPNTRRVNTQTGQLSGGGALSADLTLGLATTAVTSGTYGSGSAVAVIVIDDYGRITGASNVVITATAISAVPVTRQVVAGNNLSGGGPLSGDITLAVATTMLNQNISGGTLTGVVLSGATYSGETLSGVTIRGSTFSGGNVNGATVSGGTINNIVIGATVSAAATVTTLTASSVTANVFTGTFSGNAATASSLATARTFSISGTTGLTATGVSFSGLADVPLQLSGALLLANGGTSSTTAASARDVLVVYSRDETLGLIMALG